jgi:hypothetical protein
MVAALAGDALKLRCGYRLYGRSASDACRAWQYLACRRRIGWTGAFFLWSAAAPQTAQAAVFTRTFTGLAQVARAVRPAEYIGQRGWRTSRSKVLDNAIIGYCKLNEITPVRT